MSPHYRYTSRQWHYPPPPPPTPSPTPYSTPPLPPATHIHQQAIISRHPSAPKAPTTTTHRRRHPHLHAHTRTPFCRNPTSCTVLIWLRGGRTGRRKNGGGSLYQDDFLRWLSSAVKPSQVLFCVYSAIVLYVSGGSVCLLPEAPLRIVSPVCFHRCHICV